MIELKCIKYFCERTSAIINKGEANGILTRMNSSNTVVIIDRNNGIKVADEVFTDGKINSEYNDLIDSLPFDSFVWCTEYRGGVYIRYIEEVTYNKYNIISVLFDCMNMEPAMIKRSNGSIERFIDSYIGISREDAISMLVPVVYSINKAKNKKEINVASNVSFRCDGDKSKYHFSGKRNRVYFLGGEIPSLPKTERTIGSIEKVFSWVCCGHWRKLPDGSKILGKNRQGERNVNGMTWVKECIKGTGELNNSIRVIK